jgi:hypothetical protein
MAAGKVLVLKMPKRRSKPRIGRLTLPRAMSPKAQVPGGEPAPEGREPEATSRGR